MFYAAMISSHSILRSQIADLRCFFFQVSVSKARAIIVLASDENADQVSNFVLHTFNIFGANMSYYCICSHSLCPLEWCTGIARCAESDWSQGGSKRPCCCRDEWSWQWTFSETGWRWINWNSCCPWCDWTFDDTMCTSTWPCTGTSQCYSGLIVNNICAYNFTWIMVF